MFGVGVFPEHRRSPPTSDFEQASLLLSFRMISDTRIECQNAYSEGEGAGVWSTGSDRGGVEPWSSGSVGLDGFLSWLRQCGSHLPPLRHQPPDVLSLAATV